MTFNSFEKSVQKSEDFVDMISAHVDDFVRTLNLNSDIPIFVAVSGGADSMALAHVLMRVVKKTGGRMSALTVDHGLRAEAKTEAEFVGACVRDWDNGSGRSVHKILRWEHERDVTSRVQEAARTARYELMGREMRAAGAEYLFTAHHRGDQAETFLFRLAKGSGIDGLAGMLPVQEFKNGLKICRPFLDVSKDDLISYCKTQCIEYCHDPSNDAEQYARVRLRKSAAVLEREGLSEKRLAVTAYRIARARKALDEISADVFLRCVAEKYPGRIVFNFNALKKNPEEVVLRVIISGMKSLSDSGGYGVRTEKIENLVEDLLKPLPFRKRTLGKMIFLRDDRMGTFEIMTE